MSDAESAALANAAQWEGAEPAAVETGAAPLELESGLMAAAAGGGGGGGGPTPAPTEVYLAREYIWGPGDAWHPASVDELLVYYGEDRGQETAWWVLQDSSGDVAAVCRPGTAGQDYAAQVAAQQRYDAYGQVTSADHLLAHPFLSVGHKGLFFDRFDRGVSDSTAPGSCTPPGASVTETPRLVPFARGVYHVRNRAVLPGGGSTAAVGQAGVTETMAGAWVLSQAGLSSGAAVHGRFMQADPNATAMVLMRHVAFHGTAVTRSVDGFALADRLSDGSNLYEYLGSRPWTLCDALGLSWDPFEDFVDEYLAEDAGSKAAFLERIAGSMHTAAYISTYVGSWIPIPAVAIAAAGINAMLGMPDSLAENRAWQSVERVGNVVGTAMLAKMLLRLSVSTANVASRYAASHGSRSAPGAAVSNGGITARANRVGATGAVGEGYLAQLGGRPQVPVQTPLGERVVDQLVGTIAHESKVGYTALTDDIAHQIAKDRSILQLGLGGIRAIAWHFFRSPVTGEIGPSGPLREALRRANITIVEHVNR